MSARKASGRRSTNPRSQKSSETFVVAEREYAAAMRSFLEQHAWAKARDELSAFVERYASESDVAELVDRARLHMQACSQRLEAPTRGPEKPSEWMLEAVALANDRRTDEALTALDKATEAGAAVGRVEYVRAATLAVAGRQQEALASLARAIEADRENRAFCLADPDFEGLREMAGYVALVEPPSDQPIAPAKEFASDAPKILGPEPELEPDQD
ncbi:MAG: hypothetical protein JSV80_02035 [Acidobacteriota bacterium]|nr:MAG: hypothetical protein JSV80_02035 [Acidobacteriota bacterium]